MNPKRGRVALTVGAGLVVGLLVGALALGPATAHFQQDINHIYSHVKNKVDRTIVTEQLEAGSLDSNAFESVFADCPDGMRAIGGGGDTVGADILPEPVDSVAIQSSRPFQGTRWYVSAREMDAVAEDWTVTAYVICTTL